MDILLNLEAAQNLRCLSHLYDLTESHVRSMKSLGVEPSSYVSMLSSVLLNKMPFDFIVSRKVPESDWSLDSILKEEIVAREHVEPKRVEPTSITIVIVSSLTHLYNCDSD